MQTALKRNQDPTQRLQTPAIGADLDSHRQQHQLIIADGLCPQIAELLPGALHDVVALGRCDNPLAAISAILEERHQQGLSVDTLHIVAHGKPGGFQIGNQWVDTRLICSRSEHKSTWPVQKIALWSCHTGDTKDENIADALEFLTGAEIFLTDHEINSSSTTVKRNGQHANNEVIELSEILSEQTLNSWTGSLAAPIAPTSGWYNVLAGSKYDPNDDQQSNSDLDLVGDASNPMLQASQKSLGSDTVYWFRARLGNANVSGISTYIALDIDGDLVADIFIEGRVAADGNTSLSYHLKDPTKAGTGPSNTGWLNSTNDQTKEKAGSSSLTSVTITSASSDLDGGRSGVDSWMNIGFSLSDLQSFQPAASVTGTSALVLYLNFSNSKWGYCGSSRQE